MLLENKKLIHKYWEEVKHEYPEMEYFIFEDICKHPFRFIKSKLEGATMVTILMKYFGKFRVFSGKLKTLLKNNEADFHFKSITEEVYLQRKSDYEAKLKIVLEHEQKDDTSSNTGKEATS